MTGSLAENAATTNIFEVLFIVIRATRLTAIKKMTVSMIISRAPMHCHFLYYMCQSNIK